MENSPHSPVGANHIRPAMGVRSHELKMENGKWKITHSRPGMGLAHTPYIMTVVR